MLRSPNTAQHTLTDEAVVCRIVEQKDTALFSVLYDRYANKVFAKCFRFTHDRPLAEDLAHDIFLKTYLKLGEFRFEAKFSTWLYSITYHACVEYKRKDTKTLLNQHEYAIDSEIYSVSEAESEAALFELQIEHLNDLLEKISPEEKALLLMKYQDGMSVDELIVLTGLKESAVKMRLKRAKAKIMTLSRLTASIAAYWTITILL